MLWLIFYCVFQNSIIKYILSLFQKLHKCKLASYMQFPFKSLQVRSFYSILFSGQNCSGDMEMKVIIVLSSSESFRYTLNVSLILVNIFQCQFCSTFFFFSDLDAELEWVLSKFAVFIKLLTPWWNEIPYRGFQINLSTGPSAMTWSSMTECLGMAQSCNRGGSD